MARPMQNNIPGASFQRKVVSRPLLPPPVPFFPLPEHRFFHCYFAFFFEHTLLIGGW